MDVSVSLMAQSQIFKELDHKISLCKQQRCWRGKRRRGRWCRYWPGRRCCHARGRLHSKHSNGSFLSGLLHQPTAWRPAVLSSSLPNHRLPGESHHGIRQPFLLCAGSWVRLSSTFSAGMVTTGPLCSNFQWLRKLKPKISRLNKKVWHLKWDLTRKVIRSNRA